MVECMIAEPFAGAVLAQKNWVRLCTASAERGNIALARRGIQNMSLADEQPRSVLRVLRSESKIKGRLLTQL